METERKAEDIAALRRGDEQWFKSVYNHWFPMLYNYAVGITRDGAMAEDAVSDVFLRLWEHRHTIEIRVSLKAYLFGSVYHACINSLKHINIQDKYRDFFLHQATENADESEYPLQQLMEREITEIVAHTVALLPEQCRRIFTMSREEGLHHEEIARQLGISVNSVRTQIHRALKKLSLALSEYLTVLIFCT